MKKLKPKEPKLLTLILTAVTGIALGVSLGVSILLSKPANVVKNPPSLETVTKPGNYNTYVISGRVAASESPNLRSSAGRISRRSPGPVSFTEDEINYFFANLEFEQPEGEEADAQAEEGAKMGPLNIRIVGDEIFATFKMVLDPKGDPFELLAIAKIEFENTEEGPELRVRNARINSLPVPGLGGVISSRVENTAWPSELVEMWENIRSIEVESDKLIAEVGLKRA